MPRTKTQEPTTPEPTKTQEPTTPVVDESAQIVALQEQLAAANAAKEEAEIKALEAEQAAAISAREAKEVVELDPEDKKVLDALAEGKSAELVADNLNIDKAVVVRVAYENMNGESVYELAARLGVKANDVYKATDQSHLVRMIQYVDDSGRRKLKELDYEAS